MGIFSLLGNIVETEAEYALKRAISPLPAYLRKVAFGVTVAIIGGLGFAVAVLLLLIAFFLTLADYDTLATAALWTSLLSAGVGIFVGVLGLALLKKPRR